MSKYLLVELPDEADDEYLARVPEVVRDQCLNSAGVVMAIGPRMAVFEPSSVLVGTRILSAQVLDEDVHYWLQGLYPAGWHDDKRQEYLPLPEDTWLDVMSLGSWKDPKLRAEALADFRAPDPEGEHHPSMCKAWRMVCRIRTETALDE